MPTEEKPRSNSLLAANSNFFLTALSKLKPPTGELFGFDQTREISSQSADKIAAAAQRLGQQDDITVPTPTYAAAEVLHASA